MQLAKIKLTGVMGRNRCVTIILPELSHAKPRRREDKKAKAIGMHENAGQYSTFFVFWERQPLRLGVLA